MEHFDNPKTTLHDHNSCIVSVSGVADGAASSASLLLSTSVFVLMGANILVAT
ncbi:MAG: hypothetical protein ACJ72Q_13740 [Nitrososphaeraceae archaeon]